MEMEMEMEREREMEMEMEMEMSCEQAAVCVRRCVWVAQDEDVSPF